MIDITPAINTPIIHFSVTESALSTAKSVLIGEKIFQAKKRVHLAPIF
jgi:hypothetical protein